MSSVATQFKRGQIPWNKGTKGVMKVNSGSFKLGQEAKNKIGTVKVCTICSAEYPVKGVKRRESSKFCSVACKGLSLKGKPSPMKGRKTSLETKAKQRAAKLGIRGEAHWNWKGGSGTIRHQEMNRDEYKQWRLAVFKRDDYTCVECKTKGAYLQADHVKQWARYPELRYDINNGRTLCIDCHELTDSFPVQLRRKVA